MSYAPSPQLHSAPSGPLIGNLICFGSMLLWAVGFPAAEVLLQKWNSLPLITMRLAFACIFLVPVWVLMDGFTALQRAPWTRGLFVGGIGFGLGAWLILVAQSLTDPVTVAVVASMMPVFGALMEVILDGRRLRALFVAGLSLSVAGGLYTITGSDTPAQSVLTGGLAALTSCLLFVWGSRAAVRSLPGLTTTGRTAITMVGGLAFMVTLYLAAYTLGWSSPPPALSQTNLSHLLIYAIGSMALSQLLWIMGVEKLGVALASFHINIAPFYVMLIFLALGGGWNWQQAIGACIVALGVIISQLRIGQRVAPPSAP